MAASVLVTDGEERASLAVVRSLGRAGYEVDVASHRRGPLAGASRHADRIWRTPEPLADPESYCGRLEEIVRDRSIDVLLPITEASLTAVLPRANRFEGAIIPFPPHERFRAITDKARVMSAARKIGISVPRQAILEDRPGGSPEPPPELTFPLVLKPARSVGEGEGGRAKVGVSHVEVPEDYGSVVGSLPPQAYPLLVQEKIEGTGAGVFLLVRNGEVVAHFAHRRIREKPPSGGVSVCRESVAADPGLVEASRKLLAHFDWDGVAMVEFKVQEGTEEPYIMEVNPRFWGSLQLAIDAGVDFPRLLVEAALGEDVSPVTEYEVGVVSRWWWGEVDHLIARLQQARSTAPLTTLRVLGDGLGRLFRSRSRRTHVEVWARTDPRPFLRETADWLKRR